MIRIKHKGSFHNTEKFFMKARNITPMHILQKYGEAGVMALSSATPRESGKTASSWNYEITTTKEGYAIVWSNDNVNDGVNVAVILQYGHGTGTGGYVEGIDYINPALQPLFKEFADEAWKEVVS